ncbi:MAG: sulfur carrier protein ThiS [Acidobacteriota bacterium]
MSGQITLQVNGEERAVGPGTLLDLLAELETRPELVAIEHNGSIIPRARFGQTALADGDRIEIVQFVQGG